MILDDDRTDHEHVVAVLPGAIAATAAVTALRVAGFGSEHLGLAVQHGDPIAFEHDDDADLRHDVTRAAALGAPVGALAGMALFAAAAPRLAIGGVLAFAAAGTVGGSVLGALVGVLHGQPSRDEHLDLTAQLGSLLASGEVLIVCLAHEAREQVRDILVAHGGRLVAA
jgi:hypothetical protein